MFDISKNLSAEAASEAGYQFEAVYPDGGGPTGCFFTVIGPQSKAAKEYGKKIFQQQQSRALEAKRSGRPDPAPDADSIESQMIELACVYCVAWQGFTNNGVSLECTPENQRLLFKLHPWLRDQVIEQAQRLGNFIKPLSSS